VDVLIIDGGLAGLEIARKLGGLHMSVLLIESSTYLGGKLTKTQRPWIERKNLIDATVQIWFPEQKAHLSVNQVDLAIFTLEDIKRHFEEVMLKSNVEFLYASRAIDLYRDQDSWVVIIGNKSGRQAIAARVVIDNSDNALLTWVSQEANENGEFWQQAHPNDNTKVAAATISFSGLVEPSSPTFELPAELGVCNHQIRIVQGGLEAHHGFVEFKMELTDEWGLDPYQDFQNVYFKTYDKAFELARFLVENNKDFQNAEIGVISREILLGNHYSSVDELLQGNAIADDILTNIKVPRIIIVSPRQTSHNPISLSEPIPMSFRDNNEIVTRTSFPLISTRSLRVHTSYSSDICVLGGGTSGAVAGMISARQGTNTIVADMNPVLGGTGTIGGIHTHWMSSDSSINEEIDNNVKALGKQLKIPERYPVDLREDEQGRTIEWFKDYSWNKEVKAYVLYDMNRIAGAKIFTHCLLFGVLVDDRQVIGTVYATAFGLRAVLSTITIDATGDGDAAAFAGAEYIYGAQRDRYTMWTSMAQFVSPEKTANNFTSPADVGDVFDYTRYIVASRRRTRLPVYDHVEYVAPRETRHILGDYTITLKDQMLQKSYSDTVAVFYSNYDLRGKAFADIVLFGLMPPNLDIEIPYRTLIPKALENIIIAGKAYSITHDALSSARMQRDMQQLGAAVAIAAFLAIKGRIKLREVPPDKIRRSLRDLGILPPLIHEKREIDSKPNIKKIIDDLQPDERMEWLLMGYWERAETISPIITLCYADPNEVVPLLVKAHQEAVGKKRLLLARLLLWHRNDSGIDDVIRTIYQELDEGYPLPKRKGDIYWTTGSPEQGIMPEVLYLLYPLARSSSEKIVKVVKDLVGLIQISARDYSDRRMGSYDYIDCVTYIAERQANPHFIPLLDQLLNLPEFQNPIILSGILDDHLLERLAYLNLSIYRALARCGSKKGLMGLINFLEDNRAYLSKSAHDELADITRLSLPMNKSVWTQAIMSWPDYISSVPYKQEII
jgi:flavin-dependent dehydrogenase